MDTSALQQAIMNGEVFAGEADLENFLSTASEEEIREVEKAIDIPEGQLRTIDSATFNEKAKAFKSSPKYDEFFELNKQMKSRATTDAQQITGAPLQATANTGTPSALSTATDTAQAPAQNAPTVNTGTNVDSVGKNVQDSNSDTQKISEEVIAQNIKDVVEMESVSQLSGEEFKKGNVDLITQVTTFFSKFGNIVKNSELGNVIIDRRGVKSDIGHGIGRKKAASFAAVPDVIQNGKVVDYQTNWKQRGYDTAVIVAPISIGTETHFMGVVLIKDHNGNSFYVHEVLSMEEGASSFKTGTTNNSGNSGDKAPSIMSILRKVVDVKENFKKSTGNDSQDTRKALPNDEVRADKAKPSKSMTVLESIKFAQENVTEYAKLDSEGQARVRRLIRQAKANGFTDAETRAYARVAARSGIDIVIDKEGLYLGKDKNTRADVYADGLYSPKRNKILVNPEGTRSPARLLIHELTHAIYKGKGRLIVERGVKNLTDEEKQQIRDKYFKGKDFDFVEYADELNAHYTEALLDDDVLLEKLCEDSPTLPDKILSFFKKAITGYSDEPTLSREAKKLYKRYKQLFDMFSERSKYGAVKSEGEERYAFGVTQQDINEYISNAYEKKNVDDYKEYAVPSQKLIDDVSSEIDISDYSHALRDNDIRHIRNSHGENTNEKYPVTQEDLQKIPDIVANYDKVFVKTNANGDLGLAYVKVGADNVVYYVEAVTTQYHNKKTSCKQANGKGGNR